MAEFWGSLQFGIEVYYLSSNHTVNQTFERCNFVAGQTTYAALPNGKNFKFDQCNFYGPIAQAYNAATCQSCITDDHAKFVGCRFNEEYNGNSYNLELNDNCLTQFGWPNRSWLVDFSINASRAQFTSCDFTSNKEMKLIYLSANDPFNNKIVMDHCLLKNHGVNSNDLGSIWNVEVLNSDVWRPDANLYIYESGSPSGQFRYFTDASLIRMCVPKYESPNYPNRVTDAYTCAGCTLIAPKFCPSYPGCNPCPKLGSYEFHVENEIQLFPNPINSVFYLEGLIENEEIRIFDNVGKLVMFHIANSSLVAIDFQEFNAGLYFVSVGNRKNFKIIKNY